MSKIDLDFFEKILMKNLLKKDGILLGSCIEYIGADIFKNENFSAIAQTIKDFYVERSAVPNFTELKTRFNTTKNKEHLKKAIDLIKNENIADECNEDELLANAEYFIKQRKTENLLEKAIDDKTEKQEIDLDDFQTEQETISNISLVDNLGLEYFAERSRVESILTEKDVFLSTGYKIVDEAFGGGMFKEGRAIYGVAGSTNVGKSLLVGNIGTNILRQNEDVVIITLEMSEKRYARRISGMLTGIALGEIGDRLLEYREYVDDFISDKTSRLVIKEFAAKSVTPTNIKSFIKKLERKKNFKPSVIILDYITLCKSTKSNVPKHDEFQYITQEVRGLSYIFECPLLTPAQLNRDGHRNNSADLDNMAGSYSMLGDFDNLTVMSQTDEDRELNRVLVKGKKSRDGALNGGGYLNIDYSTLRFFEEEDTEQSYEDSRSSILKKKFSMEEFMTT